MNMWRTNGWFRCFHVWLLLFSYFTLLEMLSCSTCVKREAHMLLFRITCTFLCVFNALHSVIFCAYYSLSVVLWLTCVKATYKVRMALPSVTSVFCSVHIWQKSWLDSCSQLQENTGSSSEEEEAEEEDVDVALKKEVAQLRASETKQERRFQALDSGANNVIFIRTQNIGKAFCSWCESVFQCFCLGFFFWFLFYFVFL